MTEKITMKTANAYHCSRPCRGITVSPMLYTGVRKPIGRSTASVGPAVVGEGLGTIFLFVCGDGTQLGNVRLHVFIFSSVISNLNFNSPVAKQSLERR